MDYQLIIIGGGPAGITAGIYAARKRMKTLLITKDFLGQIANTSQIDNYPGLAGVSGLQLMEKFEEDIKKFEIEIKEGYKVNLVKKNSQGFLVETEDKKTFKAQAIIVATGRDPRPLEIPGEKEFIGKGVSYCSICDAPFFKDKNVAVIGGGNSGFRAALDLAKYAKRVSVFEYSDKIIADEFFQEQAERQEKIKVYLNAEAKAIEGNKKVQTIIYKDRKTKKTYYLPVDGVFVQIGSVPATAFVKGLVQFNEHDEIIVDPKTCQSKTPGIFAAGDVNDGKWKQVIIACGEGARAALAAYEYLQLKQ